MRQAPVPDAVLVEIVDEVFLPLVATGRTASPPHEKQSTTTKPATD